MLNLVIAFAASFSGTYYSGNELYSRCTDTETYKMTACQNYITGVADTITLMDTRFSGGTRSVCSPQDVTIGQTRDVVIKYLRDNPQTRNQSASSLVYVALAEAFPCPK